jgi:hypothetical protein
VNVFAMRRHKSIQREPRIHRFSNAREFFEGIVQTESYTRHIGTTRNQQWPFLPETQNVEKAVV